MSLMDIIGIGAKLIDKVIPDPTEQARAKLELMRLHQEGELAALNADVTLASGQIEINKIEAASPNPFASSWRPLTGYACVAGLIYSFLLQPLFSPVTEAWLGYPLGRIDVGELMILLGGMLGLGGMRTFEKVKGVTR